MNKTHKGHAMPRSQRQLKVAEEVRAILSPFFNAGEFKDADLFGKSLTITHVTISPDLKNATIYYVPLLANQLDEKQLKHIQKRLQISGVSFHHELAKNLKIRQTPKLSFKYDDRFDNLDEISRLLANPRVARDIQG